ncbi:MAG: ABC transporter ATP-binding protein [Candidatus Kariarchaeaceae archaeon]
MKSKNKKIILQLENISKSFGSTQALDNISISVKEGEILALLGENGAGKSTLMKVISGLIKPSNGKIFINEEYFTSSGSNELTEIKMQNPRFSMLLGIGMVYQHFQLIDTFNVMENITFGTEFTKYGILDDKKAREEIAELGRKFGLPINPEAKVGDLPVGLKQRVEILKQLYRDAKLLILDEPTAVLSLTEVDDLFDTIRDLQKSGTSIIFISHKLHEPLKIADRIITIRDGHYVGEVKPSETNREQLAEMIVGRKLVDKLYRDIIKNPKKILDVKGLAVTDKDDREILHNITFEAFGGRILGIGGVHGNGQEELVEALMGLQSITLGKIWFYDENDKKIDLVEKSTMDIYKLKIAYIPEDRTTQGLISEFLLTENIWLGFHDLQSAGNEYISPNKAERDNSNGALKDKINRYISKFMFPFHMITKLTQKIIEVFDVRTESETTTISQLSGGNQQKVLLGREFAKQPRMIIASEPTRGVDIGVMEKVHQELIMRRNEGISIILVSSDLDEILKLSDNLMIMYEGKIVSHRPVEEYSMNDISQLMTSGEVVIEEMVK